MLETIATIVALIATVIGIIYNLVPIRRFFYKHKYFELNPFDAENFLKRIAGGDHELKIINAFLRAGMKPDVMSEDGMTPLIQAVIEGQIETVRLLLKSRANPNLPSRSGAFPLVAAILSRNKDIEEVLLEAGADGKKAPGARLILSAETGNLQAAEKWIEEGAELETKTVQGDTALMQAAEHGHLEIVDLLLKRGADPNARNKRKETSLILAARNGQFNVVTRLVREDLDVNARDNLEKNALVYAQEARHDNVVTFLRGKGAIGGRATAAEIIDAVNNQDKKVFDQIIEGAKLDIEDEKGTSILAKAVENERLDFVEAMIAHRLNPNHKGRDGRSALHVAAERGYLEIARFLLKNKADPNVRDKRNETPLLLASRNGWIEVVKVLLEHQAEVNAPGMYGETPLLVATENGQTEIVKTLLTKADPDRPDILGRTPLMVAIMEGYDNIEIILRKAGAKKGVKEASLLLAATRDNSEEVSKLAKQKVNLNVQGRDGKSALHIAAEHGYVSVVSLLLDPKLKVEINASDLKGWTALMLAAREGYKEIVELLIGSAANINSRRGDGSTALMDAIEEGHINIAETLISHPELDFRALKKDGRTVLHLAVEEGHYRIVDLLTDKAHKDRVDLDASTHEGMTPLMMAILNKDKAIEKLLRKRGATKGGTEGQIFAAIQSDNVQKVQEIIKRKINLNIRLRNGKTPLILAAETGSFEIVKELVQGGANINTMDNNKATALSRAASEGNEKIVEYLCKEGATINSQGREKKTPLLLACEANHPGAVRKLVAKGADVNVEDEHQCTPLMTALVNRYGRVESSLGKNAHAGRQEANLIIAARDGVVETVETLAQQKIHVNASCKDRMTALLHACQSGNEEIVKELLKVEVGADVHTRASDGRNPITLAAGANSVKIVDWLRERGALIDERGKDNKTALIVAAEGGSKEIIQKLLDLGANPNAKDKFGNTALIQAVGRGQLDVINLLIKKSSLNVKNDVGETALIAATKNNRADVVGALLDDKANVDARDQNDATALIHAADGGHKDLVEILIKSKADVDAQDRFGNSPLMSAILAENDEIVDMLRRAGASRGQKGAEFIIAVSKDDCPRVKELLRDNDLKREILDKLIRGGDTPLILAIYRKHIEVAEVLLTAGADVDIRGKEGRTALIAAIEHGNLGLVKAITDRKPKTVNMVYQKKTASIIAEEKGRTDILRLLDGCGALRGDADVFVTRNGKHYHLSTCFYWSPSCEKKTLKEAIKKDLLPCSHCVLS